MISDIRRRIHAAAMQADGKECWTITDIAEISVIKGMSIDEVIRQIQVSCPHLFYPKKGKHERKNEKAKRASQGRDSWRDE